MYSSQKCKKISRNLHDPAENLEKSPSKSVLFGSTFSLGNDPKWKILSKTS